MEREGIHVLPYEGAWAVKTENTKKVTKTFSSKREAISYAYDIASNKGGFLIVHRKNGEIQRFETPGETSKIIEWLKG